MAGSQNKRRIAIIELVFDERYGTSDTPGCDADGWLTGPGLAEHLAERLERDENCFISNVETRVIMLEEQT